MACFVANGIAWLVEINVETIRRVRAATGYDLARIFTDDGLAALRDDVVLIADVLHAICEQQANARGISAIEFGRMLVGDAIADGTQAIFDASIDFLPQARREPWRILTGKAKAVELAAVEMMAQAAAKLQPETVIGDLRRSFGLPSTNGKDT